MASFDGVKAILKGAADMAPSVAGDEATGGPGLIPDKEALFVAAPTAIAVAVTYSTLEFFSRRHWATFLEAILSPISCHVLASP